MSETRGLENRLARNLMKNFTKLNESKFRRLCERKMCLNLCGVL